MLVRNRKPFSVGSLFALSFLAVLLMIFSPVFGGKNGLRFADDSFNRLSKGSSYFIPKVQKTVEKVSVAPLNATIKLDNGKTAEAVARLFTQAGAKTEVKDNQLRVEGSFGAVLGAVLRDSDEMYKNNGKALSDRYGYDEKEVMRNWWTALGKMEKKLKKEKKVQEANLISEVLKKAVEPAYNFYRVEAERVIDHAGMLLGLLVFYVGYTLWWGYAIFFLFDGLGLTMRKSRVKREA